MLVNSSMIGKIEKAKRYATEPNRVKFESLKVAFQGENDVYQVALADGAWTCTCHSFTALQSGTCSHIMAVERILGPMLPEECLTSGSFSLP